MNEMKGQNKTEVAELLSRYRGEIDRLRSELAKKEEKGEKNPFYEGMEKVADEVSAFAKEHSLTQKQAFAALYGEERFKEMESRIKMQKAKIPALSQSGNAGEEKEEGVLSSGEAWAAKKAGMSLADYLKYKK